jgi:gamma-glutamylcyclotransferase (GGCT)/AIG2-like uncharacterized protein YtfP
MNNILFVYGTLRSTFDNPWARMLRANSEFLGPATILGSICKVGEYTAWSPEGTDEIPGERYLLVNPEETFRLLDEYEGPDYERVLTEVGWVYQLKIYQLKR